MEDVYLLKDLLRGHLNAPHRDEEEKKTKWKNQGDPSSFFFFIHVVLDYIGLLLSPFRSNSAATQSAVAAALAVIIIVITLSRSTIL